MRAGKLRTRLTVLRESTNIEYDDIGQLVSNPVVMAQIWGGIEPLTGAERQVAEQLQPGSTHRITLRYEPCVAALTPRWWLRTIDGTRTYEIEGRANVDERSRELECLATEVIV